MEITGKRILVTGISGTLGPRVARRFIEEAIEVRGLVRSEGQADRCKQLGITPAFGDLTDAAALETAMQDIDIVVHCAAYLGDDIKLAVAANVTGVEHLAAAALDAQALFLHISTTSVYGEPAGGLITEATPLSDNHHAPYIQTKVRSERILQRYAADGLDVIILRPGAICAEENSYWGDRQVKRMQETKVVTWVHPDDVVNWVHADNLAEMVHLAVRRATPGDIFHAVDANIPETEFRMQLIKASGKPYQVPDRPVERPLYTTDKITALGYTPVRSFPDTMQRLIEFF